MTHARSIAMPDSAIPDGWERCEQTLPTGLAGAISWSVTLGHVASGRTCTVVGTPEWLDATVGRLDGDVSVAEMWRSVCQGVADSLSKETHDAVLRVGWGQGRALSYPTYAVRILTP